MFLRLVDLSTTAADGGTVGTTGTNRVDNFSIYYFAILDELPGDFNDDNVVDAADYVVWRKTMPTDMDAYTDWVNNFGESVAGSGGGGSSNVPEPGALALLAAGICLVGMRRGTLTAWTRKP
jgi:hypothetical protein